MIRLYQFDLARGAIDVRTFSPWLAARKSLNTLAHKEIERSGDVDRFTVPIDFATRFAGFAPIPVRRPRPATQLVIPGTVAYWRSDSLTDLSGNGNNLRQVGTLTATTDHHPDSPSHGSRYFDKTGYLTTVDNAPANRMTFDGGYTVETFIKLPAGFDHPWCGLLTTLAPGSAAGKTGDDPSEPICTLNLSDGGGLQWAVFPDNQNGISTNWGHEMDEETWWHVAVVNDGKHTTLYVENSPLLRNPDTPATGIATVGSPWLGDMRIVNRALPPTEFMTH
jgi:hypothetical protein